MASMNMVQIYTSNRQSRRVKMSDFFERKYVRISDRNNVRCDPDDDVEHHISLCIVTVLDSPYVKVDKTTPAMLAVPTDAVGWAICAPCSVGDGRKEQCV